MPRTAERELKRLCKAVQEACQKFPSVASSPAKAALVQAIGAQIGVHLKGILGLLQPYEINFADAGVMRGNILESLRMMLVALEHGLISDLLTFLWGSLPVLAEQLSSRHPEGLVFGIWLAVGQMLCALVRIGEYFQKPADADEPQGTAGAYLLMQQLQPADDLAKPGEKFT
jgi:hypothetical protein